MIDVVTDIRGTQQLPWQLLFGILIPLLSVSVFVYSVSLVLRSLLRIIQLEENLPKIWSSWKSLDKIWKNANKPGGLKNVPIKYLPSKRIPEHNG